MTVNDIIAIVLMVAVVGIVLWDMHKNREHEENEPRE
jgi:nitric oxide reductase large subunit